MPGVDQGLSEADLGVASRVDEEGSLVYKPEAMENISAAAYGMISLANKNSRPVSAVFNGFEFTAKPGDDLEVVMDRYLERNGRPEYEPKLGESIGQVANIVLAMANARHQKAYAKFQGAIMIARPGDDLRTVVKMWEKQKKTV